MQINAGEMRTKITIQQLTESQGPQGEVVETWTDYRIAWAALRPLREFEQEHTKARVGVTRYRVVMRWVPGITPKMRIMLNNSVDLRIIGAVNHEQRNQLLFLDCEEYT